MTRLYFLLCISWGMEQEPTLQGTPGRISTPLHQMGEKLETAVNKADAFKDYSNSGFLIIVFPFICALGCIVIDFVAYAVYKAIGWQAVKSTIILMIFGINKSAFGAILCTIGIYLGIALACVILGLAIHSIYYCKTLYKFGLLDCAHEILKSLKTSYRDF